MVVPLLRYDIVNMYATHGAFGNDASLMKNAAGTELRRNLWVLLFGATKTETKRFNEQLEQVHIYRAVGATSDLDRRAIARHG